MHGLYLPRRHLSLSLLYGDLHTYNRYVSNIFILVAQKCKLTHLSLVKVLRFHHWGESNCIAGLKCLEAG